MSYIANNIRSIAKESTVSQEFFRYLIVGGSAFLVDYGLFYLAKNYIFSTLGPTGVYLATATGFIAGLLYNYALSILFVFRSAREHRRGRNAGAFALFALIGAIGLVMSEGGMALFYGVAGIHYMIAKVLIAGIVLTWNYAARKLLIFR